MSPKIVDAVRDAGVVGAGGAGFPTHVKLNADVERVLANGASCEPLLMSDPYLMEAETASILAGLQAAMEATGAKRGHVCLKGKHRQALDAVTKAVSQSGDAKLAVSELGDFYPAGDEQVLVYEIMGRVVPEGGLPLQVGAVVSNVESLHNIARALDGKPVTHRYLTVTGEVARPVVMRAPIGLSVGEAVELAGGPLIGDYRLVIGGPMMGQVTADAAAPITKTTSGVIVLPAGHNVVAGKIKDPERIRNITRVACCQCSRCTDLCPRRLLGHSLEPHKIMRRLGAPVSPDPEIMVDALICSECGICEKFACPMMISPREVNAQIKKELMAQGVKRTPKQQEYRPSVFRDVRYVPTKRLVERLQLGPYDGHPEFLGREVEPQRAAIPLKQHLGAPAQAVVKVGDRVKAGDLIGEIPPDALSARVHASIDGRVTQVGRQVVIER